MDCTNTEVTWPRATPWPTPKLTSRHPAHYACVLVSVMTNRIKTRNHDDTNILFEIEFEEPGEGADISLEKIGREVSDLSLFPRVLLVTDTLYKVSTNDPKCEAWILDIPSENKMIVRTTKGAFQEYPDSRLKDVVLAAYNAQRFLASE
jgi:hypothetical protein